LAKTERVRVRHQKEASYGAVGALGRFRRQVFPELTAELRAEVQAAQI